LSATLANPFAGALRVASLGVLTDYFVIPCLVQLRREHPALVSEHLNLRTAEATELLARAELDVAFYYEELSVDGVVVERIGSTPTAIYCGRGHPLFSQQRITQRMVLEHPFSIPQIGDSGRVMDGWPSEIPRQVGMRITMLRSNLAVCTAGVLLTVLPDIAAVDGLAAGHLRRISVPALPAIDVFAGRPASGLERGAAQFLVEQVRERLSRKLERRRRRSSTRRNQL
jgi:DNA-binding transcriptional LysR family regulator